MKNFISINTVSDICSVSLFVNNKLIQTLEKKEEHSHTKLLPIFFKEILANNNYNLKNINFIAVSIGPGSYSGIKVSSSFVKGISLVTKIPIVPVNQFEAFNFSIKYREEYYIALHSHREYIYCQLFSNGKSISKQKCSHFSELKVGTKIYGYLLNKISNLSYKKIVPTSKSIGLYAQDNYKKIIVSNPDNFKSIYLTQEKTNG